MPYIAKELMETISERLVFIRLLKKLTQQKVADDLGINRQQIKAWETAQNSISFEDLTLLAKYYGIDKDILFTDNIYELAEDTPCKRLIELRLSTGLSREALVHNINVKGHSISYKSICNYETSENRFFSMSVHNLLAFCDYFNVSSDYLLCISNDAPMHDTFDSNRRELSSISACCEESKNAERTYKKEWRAKNKDKVREYNRRYWERKAAEKNGEKNDNI